MSKHGQLFNEWGGAEKNNTREWEVLFNEMFGEIDVVQQDWDAIKVFIHQQLQKARADWLRSEIEKLEDIRNSIDVFDYDSDERGKREILEVIITRYKEELKVLTGE